jgi:hypothetical protein
MRIGAVLFPAFGALALLPAVTACADVTSCRDEARQMAQTYLLSVSPAAPSAAIIRGRVRRAAGHDGIARHDGRHGLAREQWRHAAPIDEFGASEPRGSASAVPQLGAADRAKVEGLLSDAQAGGRAEESRPMPEDPPGGPGGG